MAGEPVTRARMTLDFCADATRRSQDKVFTRKLNGITENFSKKELLSWVEGIEKGTTSLEHRLIFKEANMEWTTEELKMVNEAVKEGKKELEEILNEITKLNNHISPLLSKQISDVRETRMTLERETKTILTTLKDVRKFFLEQDYQTEVKRLTEFMELCKTLKKLKDDGTLDAISETIIKLQIGGKP